MMTRFARFGVVVVLVVFGLTVASGGAASATPMWSVVASPNPPGTAHSELSGVSCENGTQCMAVGSTTLATGQVTTLAERGNGTTWSVVSTPNLVGVLRKRLLGVACPSMTNCYAVGWSSPTTNSGGHTTMLIEHWDGATWSVMVNPKVTGNPISRLTGVSCPMATLCYAVGAINSHALVIRWTGT